eukprot:TRINITY_DN9018_c0_g1_i1.p2 TRINITY_DN9018_c0_g1~~TRINITY_DN9018_c0_g1_i1.p2  ORF type:complete len:245 (+),score=23.66 TRINITY_DN9018_c0_g1_i1:57-791(+)
MRAARIKVVPLLLIGAVVLSIIVAYSSQRPSKGKKKEAKEETWSGVINNLIDSEQDHELRREAEDLALANKHLADALESLSGKRAEMMGLRSQLSELDEQQQQLGSELHRLQSEHHKGNNVGLKIKQSHEAIEGSKNLSPEEIKRLEKKSFQRHLFNEYKSSLLPLDRPVPDVRHKSCHNKQVRLLGSCIFPAADGHSICVSSACADIVAHRNLSQGQCHHLFCQRGLVCFAANGSERVESLSA